MTIPDADYGPEFGSRWDAQAWVEWVDHDPRPDPRYTTDQWDALVRSRYLPPDEAAQLLAEVLPDGEYPDDGTPYSYTSEQWETLVASKPFYDREESAARWMYKIATYEPGSHAREEREAGLRDQLIATYGLEKDEVGNLRNPRDRRKVAHRLRLLHFLTDADADEVDQDRGREFAYDLGHLVAVQAERESEHVEARYMATHDKLTGVLNRHGLEETLPDMIAEVEHGTCQGLALLYMDLDKFKDVNDTYGHDVGDALLVAVTQAIRRKTRKPAQDRHPDVVARMRHEDEPEAEAEEPVAEVIRLGGDEFLVVVPFYPRFLHPSRTRRHRQPGFEDSTSHIAARLQREIMLAADEVFGELDLETPEQFGVSFGYELWRPGMTAADLIRRAEMAMYQAKERKRLQEGPTEPGANE